MSTTKATLKRATNPMPQFVRDALNQRDLLSAYKSRPPYQRNDYLGWIAEAKRETTKKKRLDQMIHELKTGDKYMNMAWSANSDA